jgi:hypothetical protein
MIRGPFRLRAIALIAAYAVAMQGLLAAVVPPAAPLLPGVLCSGQTAVDHPAPPSGHEPSCTSACAMMGGIDGPPPARVAVAAKVGRPLDAAGLIAAPSFASPRGPQTARAPPLA